MSANIEFGTDGWRAIIAEDFTFENVETVTKSIAEYIIQTYGVDNPVIIGYDTRFMADKFAQKSAEVLNNLGLDVKISSSSAPTPAIAFSAKNLNTAGALMFTASHNPPEYCGIKYIPHYAGPATKEITDIIVGNVKKVQRGELVRSCSKKGVTELFSPKEDYFKELEHLIDFDKIKQAGINICFDPLYATALGYFDEMLCRHGVELQTIHNWRDPLYGGGMPEPKEKYLSELIELVKEMPQSVGFSNDGDADRFGVIDENGKFVTPNEIIAVLLMHLIKNKKRSGSLVKTVAVSKMVEQIAKRYNIPVIETPVGFKWIGEVMRNNEVIIGGEESGGLSIWGHIPEKDGVIANLCVLEAMAYEQKPLFKMIEELKQQLGSNYINERIDLKLTEDKKQQVLEKLNLNPPKIVGDLKVVNVNTLDGIKLVLEDDSWVLIRPSGTEPLFRVYFETNSQEKMLQLQKSIKKLIS